MMESLALPSETLSNVNPLSHGFKVKVKFDRPFKSEWMRGAGPNRTPVKELLSLDVVLYDEEVCSLFNTIQCFSISSKELCLPLFSSDLRVFVFSGNSHVVSVNH